jgi:ribosomal protein S18 acetylase RimI-like enzyme
MPQIRLAGPEDAGALLDLQHRLDAQSEFMLLEPGEREQSPARLRDRLLAQGRAGSFDLVAEDSDGDTGGGLAGWLSVEVLPFRRARHTGYLVLGVDAAAAGRGIGRSLLAAAEHEAAKRGLRRLELTVMTGNLRALGLYLRCGFQVEGLRRQALARGSTVIDEYYMGRLLAGEGPG